MSPGTGFGKLKVLEQNSLFKIDQNNKIEKSKIYLIDEVADENKKTTLIQQDYNDFKEIF